MENVNFDLYQEEKRKYDPFLRKIKFSIALNNSNFSHSYAAAIAITKSSCKYLKPYNLLTDLVLICWGHGYNEDLKFRL